MKTIGSHYLTLPSPFLVIKNYYSIILFMRKKNVWPISLLRFSSSLFYLTSTIRMDLNTLANQNTENLPIKLLLSLFVCVLVILFIFFFCGLGIPIPNTISLNPKNN